MTGLLVVFLTSITAHAGTAYCQDWKEFKKPPVQQNQAADRKMGLASMRGGMISKAPEVGGLSGPDAQKNWIPAYKSQEKCTKSWAALVKAQTKKKTYRKPKPSSLAPELAYLDDDAVNPLLTPEYFVPLHFTKAEAFNEYFDQLAKEETLYSLAYYANDLANAGKTAEAQKVADALSSFSDQSTLQSFKLETLKLTASSSSEIARIMGMNPVLGAKITMLQQRTPSGREFIGDVALTKLEALWK